MFSTNIQVRTHKKDIRTRNYSCRHTHGLFTWLYAQWTDSNGKYFRNFGESFLFKRITTTEQREKKKLKWNEMKSVIDRWNCWMGLKVFGSHFWGHLAQIEPTFLIEAHMLFSNAFNILFLLLNVAASANAACRCYDDEFTFNSKWICGEHRRMCALSLAYSSFLIRSCSPPPTSSFYRMKVAKEWDSKTFHLELVKKQWTVSLSGGKIKGAKPVHFEILLGCATKKIVSWHNFALHFVASLSRYSSHLRESFFISLLFLLLEKFFMK